MRPARLLPILSCLLLVGCQASEGAKKAEAAPAEAEPIVKASRPLSFAPTDIALVKNKEMVRVGSDPQEAFRIFRGTRTSGFESERLPAGFESPYQARVWEGVGEGFGVIIYNGEVVAAMYQQSGVDQERVNEVRAAHQELMPSLSPSVIAGEKVTYWFWEVNDQRLMICSYQSDNQGVKLTVAMGDKNALDPLGINFEAAQKDQIKVDQILTSRERLDNDSRKAP